jgi:predicted metal-dependent phosphoesterase TrpH
MILDLHIHSRYSFDSLSNPKDIIRVAKKKKLNGIAITDHGTVQGSLEAKGVNNDPGFIVIIGSEIGTEVGDIIGLFLSTEIKSRKSLEVIEEIHRQGGLAVLAHPFKGHQLNEELVEKIDLIEGFNSRTRDIDNKKAVQLAERYKKPVIAGSDAHFLSEIGASKVIIDSNDIFGGILKGQAKIESKPTPLFMQSLSQMIRYLKLHEYKYFPAGIASFALNVFREVTGRSR